MSEITADSLKLKLNSAINKYMLETKQGKTEAVNAIANAAEVGSRQVYTWLNAEDTLPHNPQVVMTRLDDFIHKLGKPTDKPLAEGPQAISLPFRMVIPKKTLKITRDHEGNIVVHGSLSIDII